MRAWYDIFFPGPVPQEDEPGLRASQQAIEALITRENERGIPNERIVLAGFSQGCAMTLQTGLRQNRKLAGLMGLSGYLPLASIVAAGRHAANQDTPLFLANGPMVPMLELPASETSPQSLPRRVSQRHKKRPGGKRGDR